MADTKPPPPRNPALRMLGLPNLPAKLPSRNWLLFWSLSSALAAALVYDRREKKRATARWVAAVAPLAHEPLPSASAIPRRVTVYLEAPPGDGLRIAQDHFREYVQPVLASSGLDWDFVVGRRQGDVRAVVAERTRRNRRKADGVTDEPTTEDLVADIRRRNGIAEYEGLRGDLVVGRHTWKEYVRGLHEGWLGPLAAPVQPVPDNAPETKDLPSAEAEPTPDTPKTDDKKDPPKRPDQPPPYNTPDDYPASTLPATAPPVLGPSAPLPFPHLLGFLNTPTRLARFLHRRRLADEIGRDVAAVCFGVAREYEPGEVEAVLEHEEKDWLKKVWEEPKPAEAEEKPTEGEAAAAEGKKTPSPPPPGDRTWPAPIITDPRITARMRRFTLTPDAEAAARQIVVPEEQIEGWTKGKLRQLGRWAARTWASEPWRPNVGNVDE